MATTATAKSLRNPANEDHNRPTASSNDGGANGLEPPAVEFIESLGLLTEADGLPRIAGRILGLLIVDPGPFQFDDLADRLQVSRGSVSTNTRLLESLGLVERFTLPGERKDLFRLGQDPYGGLLNQRLERMRKMLRTAQTCLEQLSEDSQIGRERLEALASFYHLAIENTESMLAEWHDSDQGTRP